MPIFKNSGRINFPPLHLSLSEIFDEITHNLKKITHHPILIYNWMNNANTMLIPEKERK